MRIVRRTAVGALVAALAGLLAASAAQAAGPYQLVLDQGSAFSILGHSCGGIQEESFATGFGVSGYPEGDVHLSTRCGGSGRGGGYKTTTYSAWASVVWTWLAETRSFARLQGPAGGSPTFEATDAHGDRIYNSGTRAYLETGEPPLQPPAAPTGVQASVAYYETGEESGYLGMTVGWTLDPATAARTSSSTVTATPVSAGPPVLSATTSGSATSVVLAAVAPHTTYLVTVAATDSEGTSEASAPIEVTSPGPEGEGTGGGGTGGGTAETCESISGTAKLSPGLSETPHVQKLTLKGELSHCDGPVAIEGGKFTAQLHSEGELTCSALQSEQPLSPVSLLVNWTPTEAGSSGGALAVSLAEGGSGIAGLLEGGPFPSGAALSGTIFESWTGGPECGLTEGTKKAKAVKKGTFSGSSIELG